MFKAQDASLNRVVAVKVRPLLLASNAVARKRFSREARAATISHKHVVTIYAVDEEKGLLFPVMQFIDGQSLNQRIREAEALPLDDIVSIRTQTTKALAAK